jgi:hypothetical protein
MWPMRKRAGLSGEGEAEPGVFGEGVWEGEMGDVDSLEGVDGLLGHRVRNSACFSLSAVRSAETTWRIRGRYWANAPGLGSSLRQASNTSRRAGGVNMRSLGQRV